MPVAPRHHSLLTALPPAGRTREQQVWERAVAMCDEIHTPELLPITARDAWSALQPSEREVPPEAVNLIDSPQSIGGTHDGVGSMMRKILLARAQGRINNPGEAQAVSRLPTKLWSTLCNESVGETRLSAVYARDFLCHTVIHQEKECVPLSSWFNETSVRCWADP